MNRREPSLLSEFLRSVEAFSTVSRRWLARLEKMLVGVELDADELLFRAGDPADAVYIVERGLITLFTDTPGRPVRLVERVRPGGLVGLVGVLGGSPRAASARATAPTRLLRIGRTDLLRLLERDSHLGLRFTLAVVSRHARNAAAALELGDRREVRIRVDRRVDLLIGHRQRLRATLENLSAGGLCFSGASSRCFPNDETWYSIHLIDGNQLLTFRARVAWRQGNRTGLAFTERAPGHDLLIQGALRQLLKTASSRRDPTTGKGAVPPEPARIRR